MESLHTLKKERGHINMNRHEKALEILHQGTVIPATPLALDENRNFYEDGLRLLMRYYLDSGVGGIATAVHTTQFEIRDPKVNLYEKVLNVVKEEIDAYEAKTGKIIVRVCGACGKTEQAVKEACKDCTTEREKAIALMVYIRDLKKKSDGYDYFYGGTEEELIKKGERYCERVSRLMDALCEIAGLPARTVWHLSGGHLTNEVYIDGNWAYIDPRFGLFYINQEGRMLSVEEIVADPDVIFRQPEWVYEYGSEEYTKEFMQQQNYDYYLAKREIQMYSVYSLEDAHRYHYDWRPSAAFPVAERDAAYKKFAKARQDYFADTELYTNGVVVS